MRTYIKLLSTLDDSIEPANRVIHTEIIQNQALYVFLMGLSKDLAIIVEAENPDTLEDAIRNEEQESKSRLEISKYQNVGNSHNSNLYSKSTKNGAIPKNSQTPQQESTAVRNPHLIRVESQQQIFKGLPHISNSQFPNLNPNANLGNLRGETKCFEDYTATLKGIEINSRQKTSKQFLLSLKRQPLTEGIMFKTLENNPVDHQTITPRCEKIITVNITNGPDSRNGILPKSEIS
ncbi:hypothetical protein HHI36_013254 [Cryptolaemus montrouzieri]|uniref:Uncharacterized protein n=1 Tax=Cryptolaemus montrouzieri TaxID=559131 RepID=A0ABD2NGW8_9CUCU